MITTIFDTVLGFFISKNHAIPNVTAPPNTKQNTIKNALSSKFTDPLMKPWIKAANPMKSTWYPTVALVEVALMGLVNKKLIIQEPEPSPKIPCTIPASVPTARMKTN